jgi:hypothetical protein
MSSYIGPDELIYNNDMNGNIHSGGFNVDSIMLKNGWSPIITLNTSNKDQMGGAEKVSDLFNNLVVPNWSLSYNYKHFGGRNEKIHTNEDNDDENDDVITEDLHEKLLNLVRASEEEMKKSSKENNKINKISKNKTKKNYITKKMVSNKKNTKKQK